MRDILSDIIADKRIELASRMEALPLETLREQALACIRERLSMSEALSGSESGIIAEFKRKSPSKGWIHRDASPLSVIPGYALTGASAVSVLTDAKYFGGSLEFIRSVRNSVTLPILRKDFIISEYQLLEARLYGADAVLLIAACLSADECRSLVRKAHELGLEVLLEIHSESELAYIAEGVDMVGINNRNLGSFVTDVRNSFRLAEALRSAVAEKCEKMPVLVSESGISDPATVRDLRDAGFRGFLMGENFMKTDDPARTLSEFIAAL